VLNYFIFAKIISTTIINADNLFKSLNELINKDENNFKSSKKIIETIRIIKNCVICKKDNIKENDSD